MQIKRPFAYADFGLKYFISYTYCYIICVSSCTSAKLITLVCRLRLSTALLKSCMLCRQRRYALVFAGDFRYRTQQILGKLSKIAARKDNTGASFYLMCAPANFTKKEHRLRVPYQAYQRHSPYSLC